MSFTSFAPYSPGIQLECNQVQLDRVVCAGNTLCGSPTFAVPPTIGPYNNLSIPAGVFFTSYPAYATGSGTLLFSIDPDGGQLPAGLTINPNTGVISGTVAAPVVFSVTVLLSNGVGSPATTVPTYTVTSVGVAPGIGSYSLLTGLVGTAFSSALSSVTGTTPVNLTVSSGAIPTNLTFGSNGLISGTPSAAGTFTFVVTASNGYPPNATVSTTITVYAPPQISVYPITSGVIGNPFSSTPVLTGSPTITVTVVGTLPAGLTINSSTGVITGTPSAAGTSTVQIVATSPYGSPATITQTFTIAAAIPPTYYGKSPDVSADDVEISSLTLVNLTAVPGTSLTFAAGPSEYIYIAIPNAIGYPTTIKIGAFDVPLQQDPPFNNVAPSGLFYKLVTIAGSQYRVFRSYNLTAGLTTVSLT